MFTRFNVITPPTTEPITLPELKYHLKLTPLPDSDEQQLLDDKLTKMITTARLKCEHFTRRSVMRQTIEAWWNIEDDLGVLNIPRGPVVSVTKLSVFDYGSVETVVEPGDYYLGGESLFLQNSVLPYHRMNEGIRVEAICGYAAGSVPTNFTDGMLELIALWWMNPDGAGTTPKYEVDAKLSGNLPQQIASKWRIDKKVYI